MRKPAVFYWANAWFVLWLGCGPALGASSAAVRAPDRVRLSLEPGPWALKGPARPGNHIEALGEQAGIWGSLAQGFEGWAYPFKLFDGWSLAVLHGAEPERDLDSFAREQIASPWFAQVEHAGPDWALTTTWFVPRSRPGAVFLLNYGGKRDLNLVLRFRPSLAPMHLTAGGPVIANWNAAEKELLVREPRRNVELRVRCPFATEHREGPGGEHEIRLTLPRRNGRRDAVPVAISFGSPAIPHASATMRQLLTGTSELLKQARDYWTDRLRCAPAINTPDPAVNAAMLWSVVSLDQFRVRNPDLGYGLVSGYSGSGRGTRPKYCWFFEEPTLTSRAFHWLGMSDHVAESLRFLQRFQRPDGKTVHEVVQSLPHWTNYFREFLYAYLHSDGPVYYLFAYGEQYRATGDLGFIRAEWPRIRRTLDWCFSAMDPEDGLIQIEPGDWGSSESSREVWKDTQLQGMWVRALRDMERLAGELGERELAQRCRDTARRAAETIDARLWDAESGTYLWGLDRRGSPLRSLVPHHAISFWIGALPERRVETSLERMARADFRTDWGVRSLALSDPKYDPKNYQAGSVWPVWNAGVIVSEYRHGRGVDAFRTLMAMVRARTLEGLGPMPEVLDGRAFQRLEEGVPHQMFSELAVVNGFFEGLLGLEIDVPGRQVKLAPRLPPAWDRLAVERIPCGPGRLGIRIERRRTEYDLRLDLDWPGGASIRLAPELPPGAQVESVSLDGRNVEWERQELPTSPRVAIHDRGGAGSHRLRIRHRGGVEWLPADEPLSLGVTNRNLRVVGARWEDSSWHFRFEGLPGRNYPVDFFTGRLPTPGPGAPRAERRKTGWRVHFLAPAGGTTNAAGYTSWDARVSFR